MITIKSYNHNDYLFNLLNQNTKNACQVAYSLHLLDINYQGPIIKIRNALNNETLNFYADTYGNLGSEYLAKGISLDKWLNNNQGYIEIWYNQINNNHAIQTNYSNQPLIKKSNDKYCIYFDGNQFLYYNHTFLNNTNYTLAIKEKRTKKINSWNYFITSTTNLKDNQCPIFGYRNNTYIIHDQFNNFYQKLIPEFDSINEPIRSWAFTSNKSIYLNSKIYALNNEKTLLNNVGQGVIGKIFSHHGYYIGELYELLWYNIIISEDDIKTIYKFQSKITKINNIIIKQ